MIDDLKKLYEEKKQEIKKRLEEFEQMKDASDEKIFSELAFCLCTPQSKARECDKAIKMLEKTNLLFSGNDRQIKSFLSNVRFSENKSRYIVEAREFFSKDKKIEIKNFLSKFKNSFEAREWLVENVKGLGYKEASHFLRNIGLGRDLAILDRHILRSLHEMKVIDELPKTLTPRKYLEIESKMREFATKIGIDFAELDLLLFCKQTGDIFK